MTDVSGLISNLHTANNAAEIDLEAIKGRAAAATEGPWAVTPVDDGRFYGQPPTFDVWDARTETVVGGGVMEDGGPYIGACESADAVFIAHARTDVPALVAEVERLRADNERIWADAIQQQQLADNAHTYDLEAVRAEYAAAACKACDGSCGTCPYVPGSERS